MARHLGEAREEGNIGFWRHQGVARDRYARTVAVSAGIVKVATAVRIGLSFGGVTI